MSDHQDLTRSNQGSSSTTNTNQSNTSTSGYTLPLEPLIDRNLSFVLSLPSLPALQDIRSLLISSEPSNEQEGDDLQRETQVIQSTIESLTSSQGQIDAIVELRQALALKLSSPSTSNKPSLPPPSLASRPASSGDREGAKSDTWKKMQDGMEYRLLLASTYVLSSPTRLPQAKHELESARLILRSWVSGCAASKEEKLSRVDLSRRISMDLLLALANVVLLSGGSREEIRRFMGWREKAKDGR